MDPKSIVCEFFRHGQCTKGFKCKYSHDLAVERKVHKIGESSAHILVQAHFMRLLLMANACFMSCQMQICSLTSETLGRTTRR